MRHVAKDIETATGAEVLGLACHVGDWDAIPEFVEGVHQRFGRIDGLVNNAGINPARIGPADMTLDYWRKVFSVNVEGPLRLSQCVLPAMRDQGGGSIVTSARWPPTPWRQHLRVRSSKVCAPQPHQEHGDGLGEVERPRQHALAGAVHERDDGGRREDPARFLDLVAGGTFMKRIADPQEIVGPVCYLIGDASSFVTGDDLSVSGGMMK